MLVIMVIELIGVCILTGSVFIIPKADEYLIKRDRKKYPAEWSKWDEYCKFLETEYNPLVIRAYTLENEIESLTKKMKFFPKEELIKAEEKIETLKIDLFSTNALRKLAKITKEELKKELINKNNSKRLKKIIDK